MVVCLDTGKAQDRELYERFLADMPTNGGYVGWFPANVTGENEGVELASRHGIITVPADLFSSMTVHSARERVARPPRAPRAPRLQDKVYLSFVMTEGDNLQYNQHKLRQLWDDPARGSVPISWSMSPLMLDAAPHMLNHFLRTATPADYLMAGPSGAGYVYPTPYPDQAFESYAKVSGRYMRRTGLRGLYALNRVGGHDVDYEPSAARAVERFMRPDGVVLNIFFDAPFSNRFLPGGTPLTSGPIATSVAQAKSQIADAIAGWDGSEPRFVTLGVLSWSLGPTQLAEVAASLGDDVEVVRGDELFALMREAEGR
jgi:GxGYxYP putative glycoside hydrolase C-terminal domain